MAAKLLFGLYLSWQGLPNSEKLGVDLYEFTERKLEMILVDTLDDAANNVVSWLMVGLDAYKIFLP